MAGFDRFLKTWSTGGPVSPPTDQQADFGWDYIGSAPPTVQQFNALFRWLDEKDNWLYGQIARVLIEAGLTPSGTPNTQLLTALQSLFPAEDLTYLYNSVNEVIINAGLTPDNVDAKLWDGILAYFATKTEMAQRVLRTGDTMSYLNISNWPGAADQATRKDYVDAVAAPKVNRSGDSMPYLDVGLPGGANNATPKWYVDGSNSLGANGFKTMPGGLIIQWGVVYPAERYISAFADLAFPTAFPNYCASCVPTVETTPDAGLYDMYPGIANLNQWGVRLLAGSTVPSGEGTTTRYFGWRWIAVGW